MDALSFAIAIAAGDDTTWKTLKRRLENASTRMAAEIGTSLAKAVTQELLALAKARLGEHVGEGISGFIRGLRTDHLDTVRQEIRRRSDANIVLLLTRLCDEVAAVFNRTILIALDEAQRLTDDDHRILASLSANPPRRARIRFAWSLADIAAEPGLRRILDAGCPEIEVAGLSPRAVADWVRRARLADTVTTEVIRLSSGFPLIVEGLVNQLTHGGTLEHYTPPSAFVRSVDDALSRLDDSTDHCARMLSAFVDPPNESSITTYLDITALQWGRIRTALEREHLLTVNRDGRLWFHELRRQYLWNDLLSAAEREEVGQLAYSALVEQSVAEALIPPRNLIPIADLARYAVDSRRQDARLDMILGLSTAELAVLASVIEVELQQDNGYRYSTTEQALIYAHNAFDADRGEALRALPSLVDKELISVLPNSLKGNPDNDVRASLGVDFTDQGTLVLHGRAHRALGRGIIPGVSSAILREHFEPFRLESTFIVSSLGDSDPLELLDQIAAPPYRRPAILSRVPNPALGVWVDYGGNTLCLSASFNNDQDRAAAQALANSVAGRTFGLPVRVTRTFIDPTRVLPAMRFIRSISLITDASISVWKTTGDAELITDHEVPLQEYMQRKVDFLKIVRSHCNQLERDVYNLDSGPGFAFAQRGNSLYVVDLRNSGRAFELNDEAVGILTDDKPFRFARLENALPLRPREVTKRITSSSRNNPRLIEDPVVSCIGELGRLAMRFNKRQPLCRVRLTVDELTASLVNANVRDTELATSLAQQVTVAGHRGSIETKAMRVAIHPGNRVRGFPPTIIYSEPVGAPADINVRIIEDSDVPSSLDEMYRRVFGPPPESGIRFDKLVDGLPLLLGYHPHDVRIDRP